jgi:hypothetical protein
MHPANWHGLPLPGTVRIDTALRWPPPPGATAAGQRGQLTHLVVRQLLDQVQQLVPLMDRHAHNKLYACSLPDRT